MNNLRPSEQNVHNFIQWSATMTDKDYIEIIFRDKLNRREVANACGFAKSVLQQNPKVKELLQDLENELRKRKVLPEIIESSSEKISSPQEYDQKQEGLLSDSKRVSKLEVENLELKTRVKFLENQLQRYTELSEIMSDMGFLPR